MRYDVTRQKREAPEQQKVRIPPNSEITYISWRVEGGTAPLSVGWRSLAEGNGIIDPMQIANEPNRVILGRTLVAGDTLDIS